MSRKWLAAFALALLALAVWHLRRPAARGGSIAPSVAEPRPGATAAEPLAAPPAGSEPARPLVPAPERGPALRAAPRAEQERDRFDGVLVVVVDPDRQPIRDARVRAGEGLSDAVTTDVAGRAPLPIPRHGARLALAVEAKGYFHAVVERPRRERIEVLLQRTARLSGRLLDAETRVLTVA